MIKKIVLHVCLPLLIGALIYWFYRPDVFFVREFSHHAALINPAKLSSFQQALIYSGPDFCWAYSLCSALLLWNSWRGQPIRYWVIYVAILILLTELVQAFATNFTFDWFDMLAAFAGVILSYYLMVIYEST